MRSTIVSNYFCRSSNITFVLTNGFASFLNLITCVR
ncbi:Uncharacterised protein [Enterobacter cloacae]|uniref:Uncharacterized protein n=1 Tax=Enterobacter cloacae TaxID=550 RepID=A0A0M7BHT6_ENTCL|nr:hypothetical protein DR74_2207 [Enterobacter cloacae]CUI25810.1 Uncharacterised protein [Enterobacter cloacae]STQ11975.1 Uncharacterised protein [Enterobacter cloacae]